MATHDKHYDEDEALFKKQKTIAKKDPKVMSALKKALLGLDSPKKPEPEPIKEEPKPEPVKETPPPEKPKKKVVPPPKPVPVPI